MAREAASRMRTERLQEDFNFISRLLLNISWCIKSGCILSRAGGGAIVGARQCRAPTDAQALRLLHLRGLLGIHGWPLAALPQQRNGQRLARILEFEVADLAAGIHLHEFAGHGLAGKAVRKPVRYVRSRAGSIGGRGSAA